MMNNFWQHLRYINATLVFFITLGSDPWILSKDVVLAVQYSKYSKFT